MKNNILTWAWKNKTSILIILLIIYALLSTKSCMNNKNQLSELEEGIKDRDAKITYWMDKEGKEHARANEVQASKEAIEILFKGKLDSLSKELEIQKKQITQFIEIVKTTNGEFKSKIDTIYKPIIIKDEQGRDSIVRVIDYLGTAYKDEWLDFRAKIRDNNFEAEYSIKDSLTIVGFWKKKGLLGLGKKDYFLDISSANPNTHISNVKNFKVTSSNERKYGVGVIGGYGFSLKKEVTLQPFIGVGLFYRLL